MTIPGSSPLHIHIPVTDSDSDSTPLPAASQEPPSAGAERRGSLQFTQSPMEMSARDQVALQRRKELAHAVYARVGYLITPLEYVSADRPLPAILHTNDLTHFPMLEKFRHVLACPPKELKDVKGIDGLTGVARAEDLPKEIMDREKKYIRDKRTKLLKHVNDKMKKIQEEYFAAKRELPENPTESEIRQFKEAREQLVQRVDTAINDVLDMAHEDLSKMLPFPQRQTYFVGDDNKDGFIQSIADLAGQRFLILNDVGDGMPQLEKVLPKRASEVKRGEITAEAMQKEIAELVPHDFVELFGRLKAGYDKNLLLHHAYENNAEQFPEKYKSEIFSIAQKISSLLNAASESHAYAKSYAPIPIQVLDLSTPTETQRSAISQSRQPSLPRQNLRDLPWLEQFVGERCRMLEAMDKKYNGMMTVMRNDVANKHILPAQERSRESMLFYAGEMERLASGLKELAMHGQYAFGIKDAGNDDVGTKLLSDCQCFAFVAQQLALYAKNYSRYLQPESILRGIESEKTAASLGESQKRLNHEDGEKDEQGKLPMQEAQSSAGTGIGLYKEFRPFREINDELTSLAQQAVSLKSQGEAKARTYDFKEAVSLFQQAAEIHQNAVAVMKRDGRSELGKHSQEKFGLQADKCLELKASCENFDFQGELDAITGTAVSRMSEAKTEVHFFNSAMSSYQETDSLQKALSGFEKSADAYQKAITLMEKNGKSEVGGHSLETLKLKKEACQAFHTLYENFGKDEDSRFPSEEEALTLLDEGRLTVNKTDDKKGLKGHAVIRPPFEKNGEQIELPWVSLHTHSWNGKMRLAHFKLPRHIPYGGEYVEWSLNSQDVEEEAKETGDKIKRLPLSIEAAMRIEDSAEASTPASPALSFSSRNRSTQSLLLLRQRTLDRVTE